MSTDTESNRRPAEETGDGQDRTQDGEQLRGRIAVLEEENRRLRREYLRARQSQYRRSAVAMAIVGAVALTGAGILPALRETLLILAATGGFGGALLYFLTPDRLVPASVGQATYAAYRSHATALRGELGLQERSIYVPLETAGETDAGVRLFVPHAVDWELPDTQSLRETFVSPNQDPRRGVAFTPTGLRLWTAFSRGTATLADSPDQLAAQLGEAVVEQFELARAADTDVDEPAGRISIVVEDVSYGAPSNFDHPLVSFVAVGLARGLDTPVEVVSVDTVDDGHRITLGYDESAAYSESAPDSESDSDSADSADSDQSAGSAASEADS
ncbi:hypothetical protein [Halobellus rubicundus]|uniref:DUF7982 domain-containing protein n=1 Tax=Halobellus rubicundus TaxID=2996466 RepID=A0ABD5MEM0_9EURY